MVGTKTMARYGATAFLLPNWKKEKILGQIAEIREMVERGQDIRQMLWPSIRQANISRESSRKCDSFHKTRTECSRTGEF